MFKKASVDDWKGRREPPGPICLWNQCHPRICLREGPKKVVVRSRRKKLCRNPRLKFETTSAILEFYKVDLKVNQA